MQIDYRYGDLLNTEAKYICHCVNAQGVMGSEVAKAIRLKYPRAFEIYREAYEENRLTLGSVIGADCESHIILNLVGQEFYGTDRVHVDYRALRKGFSLINKNVRGEVAFPLIGCGLAGGEWKIVSAILEEEAINFQPVVYILNDEVPF